MQREVITQFINLYKGRPCLWNNKIPQYSNKHIRYKALNELLDILQRIEPKANIYTVRKKIDNLRTIYNREKRKVVISERSGCPPDMVYEPTLWYFKQMTFLNDLDTPMNEDGLKQEYLVDEAVDPLADNSEMAQEAHEVSVIEAPPPKRPRQFIKVRPQKFFKKTKERDSEDELDCFSKMAAKTLRKLEEPTQSIALKLMSDVLYHAKMGHLNEQSGISTPVSTVATEVACSAEQVANIGSQTPDYTPKSPNYITKAPNYITKSPIYLPTSPNYISKSSNYMPKSPLYIPKSPVYTPTSPTYIPCSPNYIPSSPNYDVKPSTD